MGKPSDRGGFDAFTPTGDGPRLRDLFSLFVVPPHVARYQGRPPYLTGQREQDRLRRKGDL